MGTIQSNNANFYTDFASTMSQIELIETETSNHVCNKLKEDCLMTLKQKSRVIRWFSKLSNVH